MMPLIFLLHNLRYPLCYDLSLNKKVPRRLIELYFNSYKLEVEVDLKIKPLELSKVNKLYQKHEFYIKST